MRQALAVIALVLFAAAAFGVAMYISDERTDARRKADDCKGTIARTQGC